MGAEGGPAMQSKTLKVQNTQPDGPQQDTTKRPLPPEVQQPSMQPKHQGRTSTAPQNCACWANKAKDYVTTYQNDFRVWKINRRQPCRPCDYLKVSQGLSVKSNVPKRGTFRRKVAQVPVNPKKDPEVKEPPRFESNTTYRVEYVAHGVQPRTRTKKPAYQSNNIRPTKTNVGSDVNQTLLDNPSDLFEQFKSWYIKSKSSGRGKTKDSTPTEDQATCLSTTVQNFEKSTEPFDATTTMKDSYKVWNVPRRLPISLKKSGFSLRHEPFRTPCNCICNSTCNVTQQQQSPAEKGVTSALECIAKGKEESKTLDGAAKVNGGVTQADSKVCEEPSK
ncbi:stabilizer of axonemal microtubules 2 [Xyrichtys novacula]|uniref:Stabilizer of axonemal microtubules 2 n=1 Tax=Xyrichtys novacula TaxID=13765 RepID=A0AAV1HNP3_XYRNO|nr:stabilizer of axonemal microtubules 2 [Xyrichtys novacula]